MKTKKKYASRGVLTGEGTTVKDAKENLNAKIDAALEGSYSPILLAYKGYQAVVHRCPVGWSYSLIKVGEGVTETGCTVFVGDKKETINAAAFHIIQNGCDINAIHSEADLPDWLTDKSRRNDLVSWCRWQRAAAHAKETGVPENDIHGWACEHHHDAQFA